MISTGALATVASRFAGNLVLSVFNCRPFGVRNYFT